jgi:hypothetical protein
VRTESHMANDIINDRNEYEWIFRRNWLEQINKQKRPFFQMFYFISNFIALILNYKKCLFFLHHLQLSGSQRFLNFFFTQRYWASKPHSFRCIV